MRAPCVNRLGPVFTGPASRIALWLLLAGSHLLAASLSDELRQLAVTESLEPIRPGLPGKAPFWNEQAKQFIWAPAFNFSAITGAAAYRFTLTGGNGMSYDFEAARPWAALTPVWTNLPVGSVTLRVEALNARREVIGLAGTRQFHRAAVFKSPYGKPVLPYAQSARVALEGLMAEPFVRSWRRTGQPDESYGLYRYASKLIGAVMSAASLYATQSPRPADAEAALEIGRRAADFLLGISASAGTPLEFFPPTYHGVQPGERENDNWAMLISPAEAGQGYLDLYETTGDRKYLEAAKRIAATYRKLQLSNGTWHLKVDNRTGKPVAENELIPSVVITFLDRLAARYEVTEARATCDRAARWMLENPARTFDWSAQFDDARLRKAYQNLSKHEACEFAAYLFQSAPNDRARLALAEELLSFAEDQFVVWEHPPQLKPRSDNLKAENWFTPCSTEQYGMFEPISGSSAFLIMGYVRAYRATHKQLYLAKAESLANALTVAQQHHHGRYPTRMVRQDLAYWINSSVNTIRAMKLLAAEAGGSP